MFFKQLRALRDAGKTILIITHKLKEVLALADDFSVLRQGQLVHTGSVQGQTTHSLGELMIGRKPQNLSRTPSESKSSPTVLQIENLSYQEGEKIGLQNVRMKIHAGEIVGLAGVEGSGQSQLIDLLFRPQTRKGKISGVVKIQGQNSLGLTNIQIRKLGVNCLPEDRLHQAVLLDSAASENFLLGQQWRKSYQKWGLLNWRLLREMAQRMMQQNDVRPQNPDLQLSRFSGGNQQKFVVGRELQQQPKLLIAAQPTRGVDIGAIESIHGEILKQKSAGTAVLLVSSELDEILQLSDRIYVLFEGHITAELVNGEFDEKRIGAFMGGAEKSRD
jgi:simple sugar transport system ATP-binding protein